jgi:hypothetical protein
VIPDGNCDVMLDAKVSTIDGHQAPQLQVDEFIE